MDVNAVAVVLNEFERVSSKARRRKVEGLGRIFREFRPLYEQLTTRRGNLLSDATYSALFESNAASQCIPRTRMLGTFLAQSTHRRWSLTDLERVEVTAEHSLGEHGRLDITITLPGGIVVAIENKVAAPLRRNKSRIQHRLIAPQEV